MTSGRDNALRFGACVALALLLPLAAAAKSTTATSSGNWNDAIWDSGAPAAGDNVTIGAVTVTVSNSTPYLNSLIHNGTLVFTNWGATVSAGAITINGTVGLPPAFTDSQMSNGVFFACTNFTLSPGGVINVDTAGFAGGGPTTNGCGPGFGNSDGTEADGGGYGGMGGADESPAGAGATYGNPQQPLEPGSGGGGAKVGANGQYGGAGGGHVRIEAAGTVAVNGTISVNGGAGVNISGGGSGGGAGGGVYIVCDAFSANGGMIRAIGGAAGGWGGGGAGGRVAVVCNSASQSGFEIQCSGGPRGNSQPGNRGTVHITQSGAVPSLWRGSAVASGFGLWAGSSLVVSNCQLAITGTPVQVSASADLTVRNGAALELMNPTLTCGGTLLIASTSSLCAYCGTNPAAMPSINVNALTLSGNSTSLVYTAMTNASGSNYVTLVSVTNAISLSGNSSLLPTSNPTNGGVVKFAAASVTIDSTSGFNAVGRGFGGGGPTTNGYGPGFGNSDATEADGAGYGGIGGYDESPPGAGVTYGSKTQPLDPGSGGGGAKVGANGQYGGYGGGLVWIEASGPVLVNGLIDANGGVGMGISGGGAGGGSGGGVNVSCATFAGTNGTIRANGGASISGWGGAGGGGRIAIAVNPAAQAALPRPSVSLQCAGGAKGNSQPGAVGTVYAPYSSVLPEIWPAGASLSGFTNYTPASMTVSNAQVIFEERTAISVAGSLNVIDTGRLDLTTPDFSVGGNLLITNSTVNVYRGTNLTVRPSLNIGGDLTLRNPASLYVYAGTTNTGPATDYDVSVNVGGTVYLGSNCWIYPCSQGTNGGSVKFTVHHLNIAATNAGFNAYALGYAGGAPFLATNGFGPGQGIGGGIASGAGYGGVGGQGAWGPAGGPTYGSSNAPVLPGSGGGSDNNAQAGPGGAGGGLIWVEAKGIVNVDGRMTANGVKPVAYYGAGGGAGGGIYVRCRFFTGAGSGVLSANGGDGTGWGGGGGGGRIAVFSGDRSGWQGTATVSRGVGTQAEANFFAPSANGTLVWGFQPDKGTIFVVH